MLDQPSSMYARYDRQMLELEMRGKAEAQALIGDDVVKGAFEVRRLNAIAEDAYRAEEIADRAAITACGGDGNVDIPRYMELIKTGDRKKTSDAADVAGHHFHYALYHTFRLPICSYADIRAKTKLVIEHAPYAPDEDFKGIVLGQIAAFLDENAECGTDPYLRDLENRWHRVLAKQNIEEANCEEATRAGDDETYVAADRRFDALVSEECIISEMIALQPAASLADLRIKAVIALHEETSNDETFARSVAGDVDLKEFVESQNLDLQGMINAAIMLDILRLTKTVPPMAGNVAGSRALVEQPLLQAAE